MQKYKISTEEYDGDEITGQTIIALVDDNDKAIIFPGNKNEDEILLMQYDNEICHIDFKKYNTVNKLKNIIDENKYPNKIHTIKPFKKYLFNVLNAYAKRMANDENDFVYTIAKIII